MRSEEASDFCAVALASHGGGARLRVTHGARRGRRRLSTWCEWHVVKRARCEAHV